MMKQPRCRPWLTRSIYSLMHLRRVRNDFLCRSIVALAALAIPALRLHGQELGDVTMRAKWRTPWYRDTICASQQIDDAELVVEVDGTAEQLDACGIYAEVVGDAQGTFWKQLRFLRYRATEPTNVLKIDSHAMSYGAHDVVVVLFGREDHRLLAERRVGVRKLPPSPIEVCPAQDGTLLVDGQRQFVIALNTKQLQDQDIRRFSEAGISAIIDRESRSPHAVLALAGKLYHEHMGLFAALNGEPDGRSAPSGSVDDQPVDLGLARGLWGWYSGQTEKALTKAHHAALSRSSPYRPVLAVAEARNVAQSNADIAAVACGRITPRKSVDEITRPWVELLRTRTEEARPTWVSLPLAGTWIEKRPELLRSLTWLSIVCGAQGVIFDEGARGTQLTPKHACWRALSGLAREIRHVAEALAEGTLVPVEVGHDNVQAIHAAARYHRNRWLVVAVNVSERQVRASLTVPGLSPGSTLHVLSESRLLPASADGIAAPGATLVDAFAPHQTHVYTTLPIVPWPTRQ